ncbi:MAG: zinc ribbon domain-containing protein [Lachnospiraceae bacterium]|nr:zinc ribbon domain-containing protein [Lachnospiraceae bacterium]
MVCEICGKAIGENDHFCSNCGASLRRDVPQVNGPQSTASAPAAAPNASETVSFKNWFGTMLLPWIPVVGGIAYLVMLIAWAVSDKTAPSKKNWAKASLLIGMIAFVLVVFSMVQLMKDPMFQQYMQEYMQMLEGVQ